MSKKKSLPNAERPAGKQRPAVAAKSEGRRAGLSSVISPSNAVPKLTKPFWTSDVLLFIIFGISATIGIVVMLQATTQGIGVTTDSTVYLDVARNLLRGNGFTQSSGTPLTHYPPVYPATLALAGIWGGDVVVGAKWLHIFLYVANVVLVGLFVYRGTGGSLMAAATGLLFMLTSWPVLFNHVYALSEALFLFFTLTALLLINEYLHRDHPALLAAALVITGLAGLTRYIGFMLIPLVSLILFILHKSSYRKKLITIITISIICAIPIFAWMIHNITVSGTLINRTIAYHPIKQQQVERAIDTISLWFFIPSSLPLGFKLFILVIMISVSIIVLTKMIKHFGILSHLNRAPFICCCFLCLYAGALLFSVYFVETDLPLNDHYLLPFYIVLGTGIITLGRNAFHLPDTPKWLAILAVTLGAAFLIAHGQQLTRLLKPLSENGSGFTSRTWKLSKALEFIKTLPEDTPIYSNAPDAINFLTGRSTMMIPGKGNPAGSDREGDSRRSMAGMIRHLESSKGFLIYFKMITWRRYLASAEELKEHAELQPIYEGWDGAVYQVRLRHKPSGP
jgi:hypothetical protein